MKRNRESRWERVKDRMALRAFLEQLPGKRVFLSHADLDRLVKSEDPREELQKILRADER